MTNLTPYQDPFELAERISRSALIPQAYRGKPADAAICMMYGAEVGLPPMTALQRIIVINGKPTLDAQGMAALIRGRGHSIVGETSNTEAKVTGKRADNGDTMTVTFTMDDAKRANLVKNGPWTQYPSSMLWARAVSKLARELFPDVLMGMSYVPEEVGGVAEPQTTIVDDAGMCGGCFGPNDGAGLEHTCGQFVDKSTGEIVDAEIVEQPGSPSNPSGEGEPHTEGSVSSSQGPPPAAPEPPADELKEAKAELGALIKSLPPNNQATVRGELTELYGPAPSMTLDKAKSAITYVAGWPATRVTADTVATSDGLPF